MPDIEQTPGGLGRPGGRLIFYHHRPPPLLSGIPGFTPPPSSFSGQTTPLPTGAPPLAQQVQGSRAEGWGRAHRYGRPGPSPGVLMRSSGTGHPATQGSPRGWWGGAVLSGRKTLGGRPWKGSPLPAGCGNGYTQVTTPRGRAAWCSPYMGRRGAEGLGPDVGRGVGGAFRPVGPAPRPQRNSVGGLLCKGRVSSTVPPSPLSLPLHPTPG